MENLKNTRRLILKQIKLVDENKELYAKYALCTQRDENRDFWC